MPTGFVSWWIARITELLPPSWTNATSRPPDGIVACINQTHDIAMLIRRKGRQEPIGLDVAARLARRQPLFVRPPSSAVLQKHHVVPAVAKRQLDQMLRFELARITPFAPEDLYWRWDGSPRGEDKSRTNVVVTLVPKIAMAPALDTLAKLGLQPRFLETEAGSIALQEDGARTARPGLIRGLVTVCAGLAIAVPVLPILQQEWALYDTNREIDSLRPEIMQAQALRRGITADGAGSEVVEREVQRTGDVLEILATLTRILPDDTYLTDLSLRERKLTLGGRSAAAARLITGLSADPVIRDATFAAPVTRLEGTTTDVFSISAGIKP